MIEVKAQQSQILCSERQRRGEGAFECESARRERARGREINSCLYDQQAAGVGHVDAGRKPRSARDHMDVRGTVATPTCAASVQTNVRVASRLTNIAAPHARMLTVGETFQSKYILIEIQ